MLLRRSDSADKGRLKVAETSELLGKLRSCKGLSHSFLTLLTPKFVHTVFPGSWVATTTALVVCFS